ncbi:MAG: hypothetical protein RIR18_2408 [Pseudomonadota bacterium]
MNNPLTQLAATLQALTTQPQNAQLWCQVGFLYLKIFETQEALDTFKAAQQINPRLSDAFYGEAIALQQMGDTPSALIALEQAISRNPQDQRLFSAYAYLCSAAGLEPNKVMTAYQNWAKRFAEPLRPKHRPPLNRRTAGDKLRVGYLSADFRQHAIMDFFAPVLANHHRERFSIIAFSNGQPDARTSEIRPQFDFWNDIQGLSDQAVADLIKKRGIDILVDLSGHTEGNRLLALARQPAAVQLTWYGYNGTTGMNSLDGRITDASMDPPGNEAFSTETLYRLPSFACFHPPPQAPEVVQPPCLQNGFITFGSLNNAQKISDATLASWANLLQRLPSARLTLVGPHAPTASASTQYVLTQRLERLGLPLDRTTLLPRQSLADFLQLGKTLDIALEPFPLSGGVTTAQALWMGLPVITLAGKLPSERAAAAILHAANRPEWVAHDVDSYLTKITELASNPTQLSTLRAEQRQHLARSPLLDYTGHTRALEQLYETCWQHA